MNSSDNYRRSSHRLHEIRHWVKSVVFATSRKKFNEKISLNKLVNNFFTTHPSLIDLPLRRYLDNRWSISQRYSALVTDFENAHQKFGDDNFAKITQNASIKLFDFGLYAIYLELNSVCVWEGFWALTIKDLSQKRIYHLSFAFLSNNTVLIGSVQGLKVSDNHDFELRRSITKMTFGLRPPNLLISTLQALCTSWGVENLAGINPKFMGTKRYIRVSNRFKFNYDNFWRELEGVPTIQGYWQIPSSLVFKNLDEVTSNKRSKYRNRNLLLERIHAHCQELFTPKLSDSLDLVTLDDVGLPFVHSE